MPLVSLLGSALQSMTGCFYQIIAPPGHDLGWLCLSLSEGIPLPEPDYGHALQSLSIRSVLAKRGSSWTFPPAYQVQVRLT